MTTQQIHEQFAHMIHTYRVHRKLGITREHVKTLRHQVKNGIFISVDKKLRLLEKSGTWQPQLHHHTDADVADAIRFALKAGAAARDMGPAYLLEKWKASKH